MKKIVCMLAVLFVFFAVDVSAKHLTTNDGEEIINHYVVDWNGTEYVVPAVAGVTSGKRLWFDVSSMFADGQDLNTKVKACTASGVCSFWSDPLSETCPAAPSGVRLQD